MHRLALVLALVLSLVGCISKAREVIAPEPESAGTLTCREIVEQCDSGCGDPICVNRCTAEGTEEAQGQHAVLLDCAQRSGCTDQTCMEQSCPSEITACMGPNPAEPTDDATPSPDADAAPGDTPPS